MARAGYFAVMEAIKVILEADPDVATTTNKLHVSVIEWPNILENDENRIHISEVTRSVPEDAQPMAANTRLMVDATFRILVSVWRFDIKDAVQFRDEILGNVELAIMKNSTLDGTVDHARCNGGDIASSQVEGDSGFVSEGEVLVVARMNAITT